MCLAIPAKVTKVEGLEGVVEIGGVSRKTNLMLTPDAQVGDFVLLHTGFAISVIDEQEALETLRLIEDISAFDEAS
jgi:hydrogenase expression/formation protein HypC